MKYAVVVAHPDDESIWCSSLAQRFPGDWTAICCSTPNVDPIRAEKFIRACVVLGFTPKIIPVPEESMNIPITGIYQLDLEPYDHIFTHNEWGEYGHLHHKQVHQHVKEKYAHKKLTFFGHRDGAEGVHRIELDDNELAAKIRAIMTYNHGTPAVYEVLFKWFPRLKPFRIEVETFDGDWPCT